MAAAISNGEVSCVEVTRAVVDRIESLEPSINAFSAFTGLGAQVGGAGSKSGR